MRRAHIFWDYEFTDSTHLSERGPKPTGYGLLNGHDLAQRVQDYVAIWKSVTGGMAPVKEYNIRRFKP